MNQLKQKLSVEQIDKILPQTQCEECGYKGCRPYAEAMINHGESIDKCPPGGITVLEKLADAFELDATPYRQTVSENTRAPATAIIREDECIGCTKCIQACPVDAIVGANKLMHTVLQAECTGCGLCVEPCPVDCIDLKELPIAQYNPDTARERFQARNFRIIHEQNLKRAEHAAKRQRADRELAPKSGQEINAKQDYIKAALARVKSRQP